jgi:sec-independent protein translocase protein TatC
MPRRSEKDLFQESTMTFGQHLEELRVCLFKSLFGLMFGVIVGLAVGGPVTELIKKPLSDALKTFYKGQLRGRFEAAVKELQDAHKTLPADAPWINELFDKEGLLPEEVYVNPADVVAQLKELYPQQFGTLSPLPKKAEAETRRSDLLRMFLWHQADDDDRTRVKSLSVQEPFSIYLKASMLVGVLLASPWIFYQLWSFVAAGLYIHEKRYIHIFLPFSLLLFFAGAGLAFFFVFQPVLRFLFMFNSAMGIDPVPRINEWLGFVLMLPLAFGVAFQLPLVMLFLERIGLLTVKSYLSYWRIAVLANAVLSMLLTPEPSSMMLMFVPLTGLYFGGIVLCRFMPKLKSPYREAS